MALLPGTRLGPYEITAPIGAGGMGEVYRARDTKLNRDVALKVLPDSFASDPDRLARFTREAQTLASLNHPNIAHIHGLEESAGVRALVMELADGDDLSVVIRRSPMPLADALPVARQIADALEAAHEHGIVHRDLKPANIKVGVDGTVKVLDFGLAKAMDVTGAAAANAAMSPTLSLHATAAGVILGTAAYMSPEQARGKAVDKRADIWAFGVVLYEMLTGRQAFTGDTITDIIAAVVTREPDWTAIPAATPPAIGQLLARCLEKDPKRRLRDIGEARLALDGSTSSPAASMIGTGIAAPAGTAGPAKRPWLWIAATAMMTVAAIALGLSRWRAGSGAALDSFELAVAPPEGAEFSIGSNSGNVTISPDGTKVVFVAATPSGATLWVRSLGADDGRSLSGTEGASNPFWSPDGRRIGFFANGKLRTVDIGGGLPEAIADASSGRGGAWSGDGTIIFTPTAGPMFRVAATGGAATPLTRLDAARGENAHYWPVMVPGGALFLYFARAAPAENSGIYLGRLDGSAPAIRVVAALSSGVVAVDASTRTLYLLWVRDGDLLAQPLDTVAGALRGTATTIARDVRVEGIQRLMYASASSTGTVMWATERAAATTFGLYNRSGRIRTVDVEPGAITVPALSPDGQSLLYMRRQKATAFIYLHDLRTGANRRLTNSTEFEESPEWSPDGRSIYFLSGSGDATLTMTTSAASAPPLPLIRSTFSSGFATGDGRFLLYTPNTPQTGSDIMAVPLSGTKTPIPLAATTANETIESMSADGRWITMTSDAGGQLAASIRRLVTTGATPVLTTALSLGASGASALNAGSRLRADGREVFVVADGALKAITLTPDGDGLALGPPRTVLKLPPGDGTFSISGDGNLFVITETPFAAGQTLRVLTNWQKRLSR